VTIDVDLGSESAADASITSISIQSNATKPSNTDGEPLVFRFFFLKLLSSPQQRRIAKFLLSILIIKSKFVLFRVS
jgi:hypothetical protein